MVDKVWWIASYPKSGNTWVRLFLSAYRNEGRLDINNPLGVMLDDVNSYFHHLVSPKPLSEVTDDHQVLLRSAALYHLASFSQSPIFVKTHYSNSIINEVRVIPKILSHGAVYIVRDPRDIVISYAHHRGKTIDEIITQLNHELSVIRKYNVYHMISTWSNHIESWKTDDRFPIHLVRYEDLIAQPKNEFRKILEFLKHEINEELLEKAIKAVAFENLQHQEDIHKFKEATKHGRFFRKGQVGEWKDVLTSDQQKKIEDVHGKMMYQMGYL